MSKWVSKQLINSKKKHMNSILITGSNRGIGLELVKQYANLGWHVHACCRNPEQADDLNTLAKTLTNLSLHKLDIANAEQVQALSKTLKTTPIDILFNNAGIYGQNDAYFGNTDEAQWLECFRINTIAPVKITEALVNNVAASDLKIIATMSSKMGSMSDMALEGVMYTALLKPH